MLLIAVQLLPSLVAVSCPLEEGLRRPTTAIYAFSSTVTQSWEHAADLPLVTGLPTAVVLSKRTTYCEQY